MTKWILILFGLIFGLWFGGGWLISSQFLTIGLAEYDPQVELELLRELNFPPAHRQAVSIESAVLGQSDQIELAGSLFVHPQPNNCAVVLLPGIGGDRTQVLPALPNFWALGCHVLAYDPRGTGASTRAVRTFGYFEKFDNVAVIDWLAQETGTPVESIGIWGPSFGAAVALLSAAEKPNIGFVIADSTFASFKQVAKDTIALLSNGLVADMFTPIVLTLLEWRTGMVVDEVAPEDAMRQIICPTLLIHGRRDPAMNVLHSQQVYANRASSNVSLVLGDWSDGHADLAIKDPVQYFATVQRFLNQHDSTRHLVTNTQP